MKKSSLTTAIIAGVAGVAGLVNVSNAVNLNQNGLGDVLVYPYYTVNGGNDTLISVVNTTDRVKAVKVRFLESLNSREVLDFNLYLSPYDVWTAAVTRSGQVVGGEEAAMITTADKSCTVPAIKPEGQPFLNFAYTGTNDDGGALGYNRTRQGHIELIEMGVVTDADVAGYATHKGGVPASCGKLAALFDSGPWVSNVDYGMSAAQDTRGGLFGSGIIADVATGSAFSYNADAIEGFYYDTAGTLHSKPGSVRPNLVDGAAGPSGLTTNVFVNGGVESFTFGQGDIEAISALYMTRHVYNEYVQSATLSLNTEWVLTFPTKRYHVDPQIVGSTVKPPFTNLFTGNKTNTVYGACEEIDIRFWDREEQTTGSKPQDFSPPAPQGPGTKLCYEAQVMTFNQTVGAEGTAILGESAKHNSNVSGVYEAGWARIGFPNNQVTVAGRTLFGLPVTGFSVSEHRSTKDGSGQIASYAWLNRHRGEFVVS